jgi:3',5'-cyclic AMP phosphodiesterase CpdA
MSHFRSSSLRRLACALLGVSGIAGCGDDTGTVPVYQPTARLFVFSDPHYFAPSLGTTGPAFASYLEHDRKLIAESDAIMRAMVTLAEAENPQIVLIAGDLTKDGERPSHEAVASYLGQLEAGGARVFVVPGNHDIENGGAASYLGDTVTPVDTISAADFAAIYRDFGYGEALARDPGSLSYVVELVPGLWLLALDSCIYGDTRGSSLTSGRFSDNTKAWVQAQLGLAARNHVRVLAMMHHGVIEHFGKQALVFPEYLVADRDAVGALLSTGGVGAVFTGHFHANDITQGTPLGQPRSIYDVETGSAVTYPCPYRVVDLASDVLGITTKHVTTIDHDLGGAPDFPTYAHDSLRLGLETLIAGLIEAPPYSISPDEAATLAPWLGDGLVAHYAGDEVLPADALVESQTLRAAPGMVEQLAGTMLQSIWTDQPPADNTVTLDLAAR